MIFLELILSSRHIAKPALSSVSAPILQYFLRLFIHDGCGVEAGLRWLCLFRLCSEEPCNNELLDTNRKLYIKRIILCYLAAQATSSKAGQRHTGVFQLQTCVCMRFERQVALLCEANSVWLALQQLHYFLRRQCWRTRSLR